jgi:hypothetical protein
VNGSRPSNAGALAAAPTDNNGVPTVVAADGLILERVLDATCRTVRTGLNRQAWSKFHRARLKTSWGASHQRLFALVDGDNILAAAERYDVSGVLDAAAVRICAVGSLWMGPSQPDGTHARTLIDALLADAERDGAEMVLLFPSANNGHDVGSAFHAVPMLDLTLTVTESSRHGAPMTTVRAGEDRDLAAIVAMGRVRADPVRFHLDRDHDFIQYIITSKRLLAGLGAAHARQLHFFIAEEGITAAAYVIISVAGDSWTLEECGDRDASGARVGALLQALIAREPVERRPTIRAWLPPGFLPPQVALASSTPSTQTIRMRLLGSRATGPPLSTDDVLFWHNDLL